MSVILYVLGLILCMVYLCDKNEPEVTEEKRFTLVAFCVSFVWPIYLLGYLILKKDEIVFYFMDKNSLMDNLDLIVEEEEGFERN